MFILRNDLILYDEPQNSTKTKKWSTKYIKSKLKKKNKKKKSALNDNDSFIIQHSRNNKHNECKMDIDSLDPRRIVFVSLIGLYRSWRRCPSVTLLSSIFMMPLKREWVYNPSRNYEEIKRSFISEITMFTGLFLYFLYLYISDILCYIFLVLLCI